MKSKFIQKNLFMIAVFSAVLGLACVFFVRSCRGGGGSGEKKLSPLPVADAQVEQLISEASELKARGRYPEAVTAFENIIKKRPDLPEPYFQLGALYFSLGLKSKSEEQYLKAIERNFQNPQIYFHLGYIKESEEKFQDALEWYLKAEERGVDNAELFFNIGNVFARLGNNDRAVDYLKKAVIVNPGHMDAFVNLSIVLYQMGNKPDAEFYLDKARKLGYKAPDEYLKALKNLP